MTTTERNVRIQILVPPKSAERLDKLVAQTESASAAEVVRNALRLYEAVIDAEKKGRPLFQRIDGQMSPVLMIGPYAPPTSPSVTVPMGTREEFDRADRGQLEAMGYIVLDPPALRHFLEDGSWIETPLERYPDLNVSTYGDGEIRGDVDTLLVRIGAEGWRSRVGTDAPKGTHLKRVFEFLRRELTN